MLKIKLTRLGKKAEPRYRIVVNEARDKRDGAYVAKLGYYQPTRQPKELVLDIATYDEWVKKGAKPTETVAFLADIARAGKGFPEGKTKLSKKAKEKIAAEAKAKEEAEAAAKEAAAAKKAETEKPAEPVAETAEVAKTAPAEEKPAETKTE